MSWPALCGYFIEFVTSVSSGDKAIIFNSITRAIKTVERGYMVGIRHSPSYLPLSCVFNRSVIHLSCPGTIYTGSASPCCTNPASCHTHPWWFRSICTASLSHSQGCQWQPHRPERGLSRSEQARHFSSSDARRSRVRSKVTSPHHGPQIVVKFTVYLMTLFELHRWMAGLERTRTVKFDACVSGSEREDCYKWEKTPWSLVHTNVSNQLYSH
jgi:hypothetical protein